MAAIRIFSSIRVWKHDGNGMRGLRQVNEGPGLHRVVGVHGSMISCKRREVAAEVVIARLNFFQDEADVEGRAAI